MINVPNLLNSLRTVVVAYHMLHGSIKGCVDGIMYDNDRDNVIQ